MKILLGLFFTLLFFPVYVLLAQDTLQVKNLLERIKVLEEKIEQSELEKLISEAEKKSEEKKEDSSKTFSSGQLSMQAANPEISLTSDAYGQYLFNEDGYNQDTRNGVHFRVVGLHIQSNLDPFSMAKVVIEFTPDELEFGEAYMTWINILPQINLSAGKFRQQFGVVNRWHEHALDQFDYPLALQTILGEEGLNQTGFSMDWFFNPLIADANSLTIEITNGQNEHLFSGEAFSFPAALARLKNYFDINENTYFEIGLSSLLGTNNIRGYEDDEPVSETTRYSRLAGIDFTLFWEPVSQARYHSFLWRSELFFADKDMLTGNNITAWGGYSYIEYKWAESWYFGTRFDYTQPFTRDNNDRALYQIVPYMTWWQSEWVMLRLQYNHFGSHDMSKPDNMLYLQLGWSVGPHKHDRY